MLQAPQAKKLVSILANFLLMTSAGTEAPKVRVVDKVFCIHYSVQFRNNKDKDILALLNFESEVNAMNPAYAAHLGLKVRLTDVGT